MIPAGFIDHAMPWKFVCIMCPLSDIIPRGAIPTSAVQISHAIAMAMATATNNLFGFSFISAPVFNRHQTMRLNRRLVNGAPDTVKPAGVYQ